MKFLKNHLFAVVLTIASIGALVGLPFLMSKTNTVLITAAGIGISFWIRYGLRRKEEQRIHTATWRARDLFQELMPSLLKMKEDLLAACESEDKLTAIVNFFGITSMWQDRGFSDLIKAFENVGTEEFNELAERLKILQTHIFSAGRVKYGWNRTLPYEVVTAEKIFLGDIFGLFTKTVDFWQALKDEEKGGWGYPNMEHLNSYDVVSNQAAKFMESHVPTITDIVGVLEMKLAPAS